MIQQRLFALSVVLLFCVIGFVHAQTHPGAPYAVYVATFSGQAEVTASVKTDYVVIVFAMPGGGYDYVIDVENFTFSGDCQDISAVTLEGMVNAVADDAIAVGVAAGYPACSTASFVQSVHIWTVSCAERSGSACQTSFTPCGTNWCYRTYAVSCPGNGLSATITSAGGTASSCAQCSGEEACP